MEQFVYGISLTLLHSLWQSALLLLAYSIFIFIFKKQLPSEKRNLLYLILLAQFLISGFTFWIYSPGSENVYTSFLTIQYARDYSTHPYLHSIATWLLSFYLFIVIYKSTSIIYHWYTFNENLKITRIKPSIDLKLFTLIKAQEFGIRKKVSLWYSNTVSSPITFGFIKPVILMPVALLNCLTMDEAESLIIHELTHIKNHDYLLNYLLIISNILYFFNPFIKIIADRISLEREKNCDVQVLHFKYPSLTYAETLLKAARLRPASHAFQMSAVSGNRQLLNRVQFFTSVNNVNFSRKNYGVVTCLFVLSIICLNIFTVSEIRRDPFIISDDASHISSLPNNPADSLFTTMSAPGKALSKKNILNTMENNHPALKNYPGKLSQIQLSDALPITETVEEREEEYAIYASINEEEEMKEVIVNEENSLLGQSVTKAYKMILVNGKWIVIPKWMFTQSNLFKDSIQLTKDSIVRPFHIIQ